MKDRKAFNFYRSYWETAKKLEGEDRLKFYDALLEKQFLNKDPKLEGLSDLVYTSQRHSIESQVSGYLSKIQSLKENPPQGGRGGGGKGAEEPPSQQEKEKGKEEVKEQGKVKEKKNLPSLSEFLNYAKDKAYEKNLSLDETKVELKYESWIENKWRTGKDKKINNWKSTLLNTLPYLQKEKSCAKKQKDYLQMEDLIIPSTNQNQLK